jgi:hypothetical protein
LSEPRFDDWAVIVTGLATGTFDTDVITDAGTSVHRDVSGPYATDHATKGPDARTLLVANWLLSGKALHRVTRLAMGIPRAGTFRALDKSDLIYESDKYG